MYLSLPPSLLWACRVSLKMGLAIGLVLVSNYYRSPNFYELCLQDSPSGLGASRALPIHLDGLLYLAQTNERQPCHSRG